jgi:flagella basal body P-ring formation protein FlgA
MTLDRTSTFKAAFILLVLSMQAVAGSVRLWDGAVVVDDLVHVRDICSIEGFQGAERELLGSLMVTKAPLPGESMRISSNAVREAISADGRIRMVDVLLKGAAECLIARPENVARETTGIVVQHGVPRPQVAASKPSTLREKLNRLIQGQLDRFNARVSVRFDQESQPLLDLREPEYSFEIRNRSSSSVGLLSFDIAVLQDGRQVRRATVLARVEATRPTVVAARAINQAERIDREDLDIIQMAIEPGSQIGITDPDVIIGQRAKRHIPEGSKILAGGLEDVPLVFRGELVSVIVNRPGIKARDTGYAMNDGVHGDMITVRMGKRRGKELDGVVKGKGLVEIGPQKDSSDIDIRSDSVHVRGTIE